MFFEMLLILSVGFSFVWAAPPDIQGFTRIWSEDFVGASNNLPDPANWIVDTGTGYPGSAPKWGTGEIQTYTSRPENLRLTGDGNLQITPLRDYHDQWTSGRIESRRTDFQAQPGGKMRISARIMMPNVTGEAAVGYWPAFWTMGENFRGNYHNWPAAGEYDIMEVGYVLEVLHVPH